MVERERERVEVRAADGWRLGAVRIPPVGTRRGAALLLPAMMADARSLDRPRGSGLGSMLAAAGWEVFLADFRGHGASGPVPSDGGTWSYHDLVRYDLPALVGLAREGGGPVAVVGHSLGAHVSAAALGTGRAEADALVMLGGNTWLPSLEPGRRRRAAKALSMGLFRLLVTTGPAPIRRLRLGSADEARPYVRDLVGFYRRDFWGSPEGEDYLAALARVGCPALSVVGRGDRLLCHVDGARRWAAGLPRCELWHVGRGDHGLDYDPGHMDLGSDPRSRGLWEAIAAWLGERHGAGS